MRILNSKLLLLCVSVSRQSRGGSRSRCNNNYISNSNKNYCSCRTRTTCTRLFNSSSKGLGLGTFGRSVSVVLFQNKAQKVGVDGSVYLLDANNSVGVGILCSCPSLSTSSSSTLILDSISSGNGATDTDNSSSSSSSGSGSLDQTTNNSTAAVPYESALCSASSAFASASHLHQNQQTRQSVCVGSGRSTSRPQPPILQSVQFGTLAQSLLAVPLTKLLSPPDSFQSQHRNQQPLLRFQLLFRIKGKSRNHQTGACSSFELKNISSSYYSSWRSFSSSSSSCDSQPLSPPKINMSGDSSRKSVAIVGSGNWGSAIAKIVGANTVKYSDVFEEEVRIYVYEELVDGRKLTEIINEDHENVKYLPGHKLPTNVVAIPDVVEAASNADIIIFVLPHQFIKNTCQPLVGKTKPGAFGLSLIKGFDIAEGGGIDLISHIITRFLKIPCSVLMGANLANEIANEKFSETTIGTHDVEQGQILHKLIQTDFFRVVVVADVETVEICGALKNIVAVGAGFVDGLEYGDNTKAAVIRLGLMEMIRFAQEFYGSNKLSTFLESCGVADLITTCYGGRNRKVSEAFVRTGKTLAVLEQEMLNGQRLQGPMTASEVHHMLESRGLLDKFPLFTAVHRICAGELEPKDLIDSIRNHPEHTSSSLSKSSL